jgi:hypothetical protein
MVKKAAVRKLKIVDGRWHGLEGKPFLLDLGCGDNKKEGCIGIDKFETASADFVHDLNVHPWPCDSETVDGIQCSHFFEHLSGFQRPNFMDECYRLLKVGSQLTIIVPDADSHRAIQDFTHAWPPVCAESFLYFNKQWRDQNKLTHGWYSMKCNFDFGYGFALDSDIAVKNQELQQFAIKHYRNHSTDLIVTLTKK